MYTVSFVRGPLSTAAQTRSAFHSWHCTYAPLYGPLADRRLYSIHLQHARHLIHQGATPIPPFDTIPPGLPYPPIEIPSEARRLLGEFYTPPDVADLLLDRIGYTGQGSLLDPTCGDGVFLTQALKRGGRFMAGYEINPLTVMCARLHNLPVELRDVFSAPDRQFDFVVGNPPWINWRTLGPAYRRKVAPLWQKYGLFSERGLRARLGSGMDDLSALLTYFCGDHYLAPGGRLAFVLPQTLLQSSGGGAGFRRFELPGNRFFRVLSVDDLSGRQLFEGASNRAAIIVLELASQPTTYPVPYRRQGHLYDACPVSPTPTSPWIITKRGAALLDGMRGESRYQARVGAHAGGAAGVFWVDILDRRGNTLIIRNRANAGRTPYPVVTTEIEAALVHPLVRGRDVDAWSATPSAHIILAHHPSGRPIAEAEMIAGYPLTHAYFEQFRDQLLDRPHYRHHFASARAPYWSMYNVGAYTFALYRLVWREQSSTLTCAVIEHDAIADAKLVVVPCTSCDEAHYLAAVLNSSPARGFVDAYTVKTQISTHVLKHLYVPQFDLTNELHTDLARLARAKSQSETDDLVTALWQVA